MKACSSFGLLHWNNPIISTSFGFNYFWYHQPVLVGDTRHPTKERWEIHWNVWNYLALRMHFYSFTTWSWYVYSTVVKLWRTSFTTCKMIKWLKYTLRSTFLIINCLSYISAFLQKKFTATHLMLHLNLTGQHVSILVALVMPTTLSA